MEKNLFLGEYAWKPVIVSEIMNEFKMDTLWIDSAGYFARNCIGIVKQKITDRGIYIGSSRKYNKLGLYSIAFLFYLYSWKHARLRIPSHVYSIEGKFQRLCIQAKL